MKRRGAFPGSEELARKIEEVRARDMRGLEAVASGGGER